MFQAILGVFQAIPALVDVIKSLVEGVKEMVAAQKLAAQNEWLNRHREIIHSLKRASTDADRWVALRALQKASQDFPD